MTAEEESLVIDDHFQACLRYMARPLDMTEPTHFSGVKPRLPLGRVSPPVKGSAPYIAQLFLACPEVVSVGFREPTATKQMVPLEGWWYRLWSKVRGKPTYTERWVGGGVTFTAIHKAPVAKEVTDQIEGLVRAELPAGIPLTIEWAKEA